MVGIEAVGEVEPIQTKKTRNFSNQCGGKLMERGFFDSTPGFLPGAGAGIRPAESSVVQAAGEHQFVGHSTEQLTAEAQVVGTNAVILNPTNHL